MDVVNALKEDGEYHPYPDFLVWGNPANPKRIVLFEKRAVFELAVRYIKDNVRYLFICSMGIPSVRCLSFLRKYDQKMDYIGDLDPIGIYVYLAFKHLKRIPKPEDRPKLKVSWLGLTAKDYTKYVEPKDATLDLRREEVIAFSYINKFRLPELKDEFKFLVKRNKKVEIESLNLVGFEQYLIDKIHL